MKRLLFALTAITALFAPPVLAADIPLKAPPILLFDWTGFYVGGNAGYSWGSSLNTTTVPTLSTYNSGVTHRGWEGSVEIGYCYQGMPTRAFLACLQARYDFPRERSASTTIATVFPGTFTPTTVNATTHIDPLLIGPRLGFLTNANHTFWYGAGGAAIGQVGGSATGSGLPGTSTASPPNTWVVGWYVGAGVEQMLTNNWGLSVEYDYVSLNTNGVTAPFVGTSAVLTPVGGSPATATLATRPFDNVVSVSINYHFH